MAYDEKDGGMVSKDAVMDILIWYEVNGQLDLKQTMELVRKLPVIFPEDLKGGAK